MYAAAGEAVAQAEKSTWDKLIASRIFKPLGMTNSDTSSSEMQKARDYSFGYDYNPSTKVTRRLRNALSCSRASRRDQFQRARHGPVGAAHAQ